MTFERVVDKYIYVMLSTMYVTFIQTKSFTHASINIQDYYNRIYSINNIKNQLPIYKLVIPDHIIKLDYLNGLPAPGFTAVDIHQQLKIVAYSGKQTLLNFTCISCGLSEITILNKLTTTYEDHLEIISLYLDEEEFLLELLATTPVSYTTIPNASEIIKSVFRMNWGFPKNMLIDGNGRIVCMVRGFQNEEDDNFKILTKFIEINLHNSKTGH